MSIIEEIKDDIPHEYGCHAARRYHDAIEYQKALNAGVSHECNCSRRRKIAFLERLDEPTQRMKDAFDHAPGPATGWYALKVMLKVAEEDLP